MKNTFLDVPCPVTLSTKQADYQFNGAMVISGLLKVIIPNIIPKRVDFINF